MKFLYKIVLGLMLFNSILLLFSGFFPTDTDQYDAINITGDSDYQDYKITGGFFSFGLDSITLGAGAFAVFFSFGLLASWAMKSPVPIGAGLFSGLIAGLYVGPAVVIYNLTDNIIVTGIIGIISIAIGVLAFIAIIEMFSGTGGAN